MYRDNGEIGGCEEETGNSIRCQTGSHISVWCRGQRQHCLLRPKGLIAQRRDAYFARRKQMSLILRGGFRCGPACQQTAKHGEAEEKVRRCLVSG